MKDQFPNHLTGKDNRIRILRMLNNRSASFIDEGGNTHNWSLVGIEGDEFLLKSDNRLYKFKIEEPYDKNFIQTIIRFGYKNLQPINELPVNYNNEVSFVNLKLVINEFNLAFINFDFGALNFEAFDKLIRYIIKITNCILKEELNLNPNINSLIASDLMKKFDEILLRLLMATEDKLKETPFINSLNEYHINILQTISATIIRRQSENPLIIKGKAHKTIEKEA